MLIDGESGGIRTPDPRLRRPMLYPTELLIHGAGEGDRTLATSLEGWGSTTELHPHDIMFLKKHHLKWCPEAESNHRHGDFQSPALPTELSGLMVGLQGFEPRTCRL